MKFYEKAKKTLLDTDSFFREAKKEETIRHALKYLLTFTLIFLLFTTYYYVSNINILLRKTSAILGQPPLPQIEITLGTFILFYIGLTAYIMLFSFARYWIIHLFVRAFNKKARYKDSYKALTYSITPGYLGGPFLLISFMLAPFLSNWWAMVIFAPSIIIYAASEIYSVYLRSKALSIVQGISQAKALLCIYVFGFIALMLAALIVEIIVIAAGILIMSLF